MSLARRRPQHNRSASVRAQNRQGEHRENTARRRRGVAFESNWPRDREGKWTERCTGIRSRCNRWMRGR